jgi:DNA-binding SARP family transcriptional activator
MSKPAEPVVRARPVRDADQALAHGMKTAGTPQDMALSSVLALGASWPGDPDTLALRIGVLGPLTVNGHAGALVPAQSQLILALALTRGGLGNAQLRRLLGADAGHPKPADSLRQLIVRTRRALGQAPGGREWIEHLGHGHYALHPDAWLDWREFETLTDAGIQRGEAPPLSDALGLVRGEPFAGCYYWWLEPELVDTVITRVVAAAEALATLNLAGSDPAAAARAARAGLAADSSAEQLWRVLMRAEHAAGNLAGVRGAWGRCLDVVSDVAADGKPDAATSAVYCELLGT